MRRDTAQKSNLRLKAGGRANYFFEIQEAESCVLSHPEPHDRNRFFLLRAEGTFLNPDKDPVQQDTKGINICTGIRLAESVLFRSRVIHGTHQNCISGLF